MKSIILVSILLGISSCRPESVLNKKLDGEWTLNTINGIELSSGFSQKLNFNKKKAGGDATFTSVTNGITESKSGTYSLLKSYTITVAIPNSTGGYPYDVEIYDVTESTKSKLELKRESDSKTFIYSK